MAERIGRKVEIRKIRRMSPEGLANWNKNSRMKLNRNVYPRIPPVRILPYSCNTEKKLAEWLYEEVGSGHFIIFTWGKLLFPKNKDLDKKYVNMCSVQVKCDLNDKVRFVFTSMKNLTKFKFWRKGVEEQERPKEHIFR